MGPGCPHLGFRLWGMRSEVTMRSSARVCSGFVSLWSMFDKKSRASVGTARDRNGEKGPRDSSKAPYEGLKHEC